MRILTLLMTLAVIALSVVAIAAQEEPIVTDTTVASLAEATKNTDANPEAVDVHTVTGSSVVENIVIAPICSTGSNEGVNLVTAPLNEANDQTKEEVAEEAIHTAKNVANLDMKTRTASANYPANVNMASKTATTWLTTANVDVVLLGTVGATFSTTT